MESITFHREIRVVALHRGIDAFGLGKTFAVSHDTNPGISQNYRVNFRCITSNLDNLLQSNAYLY